MKKQLKRWLGVLGVVAMGPVSAATLVEEYDLELDGVWRGELKFEPGWSLALGINIKEGILTLDSPNQGAFGDEPTSYTLSGNTVSFVEKKLKVSFKGRLEGDTLKGQFTQGKTVDIELQKLDASDRERQKFEASYKGDLIINKTATLPLQLNVAVVPGGYIGMLYSPSQHPEPIPLTEMVIDDKQISFKSPVLNASYSATFKNGAYEGTFIQGMERPLTLKKVTPGEEGQASVPKPKAGEHGGVRAVITPAGVETEFYADHNANTLYEIGSNTKTMVAYLLAKTIVDGNIKADATLADYWPEAPADITLVQLASHRSGLPRLPENLLLEETNYHDPYASYGRQQMQEALASVTPGEKNYLYSNFGFGALGEALALNADQPFVIVLAKELLMPLAMENTYVAITGIEDAAQLAQGFDLAGNPVSAWHFDAMAGAGAVVSTLDDMVSYVQAMMQKSAAKDPVMQLMLNPAEALGDCCSHPLGWMLEKDKKGRPFAWHAGQTAGFSSVIGFYLDGSRGMVLLNNQSIGIEEQMLHWLTEDDER